MRYPQIVTTRAKYKGRTVMVVDVVESAEFVFIRWWNEEKWVKVEELSDVRTITFFGSDN